MEKQKREIDIVAEDNVEFQKRRYLPPNKYIVETVMSDKEEYFTRHDKKVRVWGRTMIYDAEKCKTAVPVCFAERKYPGEALLLYSCSASKQEAVATHVVLRDLPNKNFTVKQIKEDAVIRSKIWAYIVKNQQNENFKHLKSVRELLIKDMQATSKQPHDKLNAEIGKIRNILMQDDIKDKNFLPGTLEINYYNVKTFQMLNTPKDQPRQFFTVVSERKTHTEMLRIPSSNKPQAKRIHKMALEAVQEKGPQIIYEKIKDNYVPRKKGIHRPKTQGESLEHTRF